MWYNPENWRPRDREKKNKNKNPTESALQIHDQHIWHHPHLPRASSNQKKNLAWGFYIHNQNQTHVPPSSHSQAPQPTGEQVLGILPQQSKFLLSQAFCHCPSFGASSSSLPWTNMTFSQDHSPPSSHLPSHPPRGPQRAPPDTEVQGCQWFSGWGFTTPEGRNLGKTTQFHPGWLQICHLTQWGNKLNSIWKYKFSWAKCWKPAAKRIKAELLGMAFKALLVCTMSFPSNSFCISARGSLREPGTICSAENSIYWCCLSCEKWKSLLTTDLRSPRSLHHSSLYF